MTINDALVMSTSELLLWGAAAGAMALVVLLAMADVMYSRSRAAVRALVYLSGCWIFVALFSGLIIEVWPAGAQPIAVLQVLLGPVCSALGSYWCNVWLSAQQRDRLITRILLGMTAICLMGLPLCFLLEPAWRLPASAALSIASLCVSLWVSVRAAQLGDKLAWGLAAGCVFTLPMEMGLYAMVLESGRPSFGFQAGVAGAGVLSFVVMAVMLGLRNRRTLRLSRAPDSGRDPITRLHNSTVMVKKIIHAQERRSRTRHDGALITVMVFEPERLLSQVGQSGLNDIYIQLTRRMLRHTGAVNPAGRYYDRCFMVLIETLHSPRWIRTLGLRVASSLRKPIEVTSLTGERIEVKADVAVGIVHMSASAMDLDQLLDEAQSVARAARSMRSRAALLDTERRHAVAVESADLGDSWQAMKTAGAANDLQTRKSQWVPLTRAVATTRRRNSPA